MKAPLRTTAVAVLLTPAACTDPAPPPQPAWPPPLRLPAVAAGAACPVDTPRPFARPDAPRVLGDGPLHPVAGYFGAGTVLRLSPGARQPDGSYELKVRWVGEGYRGPVLLRADRIDGEGSALASFLYVGEERDGSYHAEILNVTSDLPGTTTVSGPGCYAVQVDGTTFSATIVFRAS
jgi:hypothetical protein